MSKLVQTVGTISLAIYRKARMDSGPEDEGVRKGQRSSKAAVSEPESIDVISVQCAKESCRERQSTEEQPTDQPSAPPEIRRGSHKDISPCTRPLSFVAGLDVFYPGTVLHPRPGMHPLHARWGSHPPALAMRCHHNPQTHLAQ